MRTQLIDKTVVVSSVKGNAQVLLADGTSRPLQPGEILQPGAKLHIADDGKLVLTPFDDSPNAVPTKPAAESHGQPSPNTEPTVPTDVAALQRSILQGADPTQNFEAPAAGGTPTTGGQTTAGGVAGSSGNGGFVVVDRVGDATIAEAGFNTGHDAAAAPVVIQQAGTTAPENQLSDQGESVTTLEDQTITGDLLANSSNPDSLLGPSILSYDWGNHTGIPVGTRTSLDGIGSLIINGDGTYSFTPASNYDGPVPSVSYLVTDGVDEVRSTLSVTITPVDDGVSLTGLSASGGGATVHEANLATGSNPDEKALIQEGAFGFSAPDGVQRLSIGGLLLINDGVIGTLPQSLVTPQGNALRITAVIFDPLSGTGTVTYAYSLQHAGQQPTGDGSNALTEAFDVTLVDRDGDTISDSLSVAIVDDVPQARGDDNTDTASERHEQLTGNVLGNDTQGADGAVVTATTLNGTYGSLVLEADGTYRYTLNPDSATFKALGGGGVGSETFTYQLVDTDGDTSSATLLLHIQNDDDGATISKPDQRAEGVDGVAYEAGLPAGSEAGRADVPTTVTGIFTISAPDGVKSLTIGSIQLITAGVLASGEQTMTTPQGNSLIITGYDAATGVVSYRYELLHSEPHPTGNGNNTLSETFAVRLEDSDGDVANNTLTMQIIDDVPSAHADSNNGAEGATLKGNVLTDGTADVLGADGAAVVGGVVGGVVGVKLGGDTASPASGGVDTPLHGQYGALTLKADGSYSYVSQPDKVPPSGATEVFTYTIEDQDGDQSTTTLTISLSDSGLAIDTTYNRVTVSESALDTVKDIGDLVAGTVTGSLPGSRLETATNQLVTNGGVGSLSYSLIGSATGSYGTLQLNGDGSYTYTLSAPYHSNPAADDRGNTEANRDSFAYRVTDANGNMVTGTIQIDIVDDVPSVQLGASAERAARRECRGTGHPAGE